MANKSGNAYGLTVLSPIINGAVRNESYSATVRQRLQNLPVEIHSPMAKVKNTYLCRFFVLNDVFYEGKPAVEEHLKSKYLVFSSNFHGGRDDYLRSMWEAASESVQHIWEYCVGFDKVRDAESFIAYIKKCQVTTTLFFNGSTDDSLEEQLKGLYLKEELSRFVYNHQGKSAGELQTLFAEFIKETEPRNLSAPTWRAGACDLAEIDSRKPVAGDDATIDPLNPAVVATGQPSESAPA